MVHPFIIKILVIKIVKQIKTIRRNTMSYSVDILKKSVFDHEIRNLLDTESTKLRMGNLAHNIVLTYFKTRLKEIDESTKGK
jgi:hypothetical protein